MPLNLNNTKDLAMLQCRKPQGKRSQIRRTAVTTETGSHGDKTKAHIQRPHFRQWCFRTRSQKSTLHSWHFLSSSQGWLQLMGSATQQLFFPILFHDHQNVNALSASVHYRPPARATAFSKRPTVTTLNVDDCSFKRRRLRRVSPDASCQA